MFGTFFLGALYLQHVRHYDAMEIGLAFLPVTVLHGDVVGAVLRAADHPIRRAARLPAGAGADRRRARRCSPWRRPTRPTGRSCCRQWRCSVPGAGCCFPAMMGLAMSGVAAAPGRAGLRAGQHHRPGRRRARPGRAGDAVHHPHRAAAWQSGKPPAEALTGGYHLAFWIATVLVVVAVGIGLLVLQNPASAAELAEANAQPADAGDVDAEADELVYQAA